MAKKDSKKKEKRAGRGGPQDAVEAVRAAVERTFQASAEGAQSTRERTRELIDEVASAATRVRQTFEELRVLDELKGLRGEVEALARRVSELEAAGRAGAPTSGRTASTRRAMTAAGGGRSSAAGRGARPAAAGGARKSSAA